MPRHGDAMRHKIPVLVRTIGIVYVGLLAVMAGFQRHFIYHPSRASERALLDQARDAKLEPWRDHRDEIVGWRSSAIEQARANNAVVVFHGNAGYALHRTYFVQGFESIHDAVDWQVYLFEYPGYGARSGRPCEVAIKQAADEAFRLLRESDQRVFLIGESLGSGVACYLAGKYAEEIAGLLLITPFTSLVDVGRHHYPILPVRLLLRERYDSSESLRHYRGPVAFLLAGRDEVIPTPLGRRLYEEYEGPKELFVHEDGTHNTLTYEPGAVWWREVTEFLLRSGR